MAGLARVLCAKCSAAQPAQVGLAGHYGSRAGPGRSLERWRAVAARLLSAVQWQQPSKGWQCYSEPPATTGSMPLRHACRSSCH